MTDTKTPSAEALAIWKKLRGNRPIFIKDRDGALALDAFAERRAAEAPQVIVVSHDEYDAMLSKLSSGELLGKEYPEPSDEFLAGYVTGKREGAAEARRQAMADVAPAWEARGTAWRMVQDAIQELGPVGALDGGDSQGEPPNPIRDAERIIVALQKMIAQARRAAIAECADTCRSLGHYGGSNVQPAIEQIADAIRALADKPAAGKGEP